MSDSTTFVTEYRVVRMLFGDGRVYWQGQGRSHTGGAWHNIHRGFETKLEAVQACCRHYDDSVVKETYYTVNPEERECNVIPLLEESVDE